MKSLMKVLCRLKQSIKSRFKLLETQYLNEKICDKNICYKPKIGRINFKIVINTL